MDGPNITNKGLTDVSESKSSRGILTVFVDDKVPVFFINFGGFGDGCVGEEFAVGNFFIGVDIVPRKPTGVAGDSVEVMVGIVGRIRRRVNSVRIGGKLVGGLHLHFL